MRAHKLKYVTTVSSSNQMYSGTGRVVFDWLRYSSSHFDHTIIIDNKWIRNTDFVRQKCCEYGFNFIVTDPDVVFGAADTRPRFQFAQYLKDADIVEVHSWANAATNLSVIAELSSHQKLVFTPHFQPEWTLGQPWQFYLTTPTMALVLQRADYVAVLSPDEHEIVSQYVGGATVVDLVGNGVDTDRFKPGTVRREYVCSVFDFAEARKRADLLFATVDILSSNDNPPQFVVAGRGSDKFDFQGCSNLVTALGYVDEDTLLSILQEAGCFVLLSDYEAFGLPIAEALCCGVPVVINQAKPVSSIFSGLPGVHLVDNSNISSVAEVICSVLTKSTHASEISSYASMKFSFDATYGRKLSGILSLIERHRDAI